VVYLVPSDAVFVFKKFMKGREKECGMWPDDSPGRGSGSVPRYLPKHQSSATVQSTRRLTVLENEHQEPIRHQRLSTDPAWNWLESVRNLNFGV